MWNLYLVENNNRHSNNPCTPQQTVLSPGHIRLLPRRNRKTPRRAGPPTYCGSDNQYYCG